MYTNSASSTGGNDSMAKKRSEQDARRLPGATIKGKTNNV